jgi:hypothetical protein
MKCHTKNDVHWRKIISEQLILLFWMLCVHFVTAASMCGDFELHLFGCA